MTIGGDKKQIEIKLIKTYKNHYKIPNINSKGAHVENMKYHSQQFLVKLDNLDAFNYHKDKFLEVIGESYDMAKNYWQSRLEIKTKKGMAKGMGMNGEKFYFDNNPEKADKLARQYLSDDWCE